MTAGNLPTTLDLSEFFTDPDGDSLTYTLGDAADSNVASAVVEDSTLSITPLEDGTASFLVTATDPAGLSAAGTIEVSVVSPPPPEPTPTHADPHPHRRLSPHPHPRLSQRPHLPLCLQLPQRLRPPYADACANAYTCAYAYTDSHALYHTCADIYTLTHANPGARAHSNSYSRTNGNPHTTSPRCADTAPNPGAGRGNVGG